MGRGSNITPEGWSGKIIKTTLTVKRGDLFADLKR
jgi:hypothetical protein